MKTIATALALALLIAPLTASADDGKMDHSTHAAQAKDGPATADFMAVHEAMMKNMTMKMTGDTDVDFVSGMIPHHQGAIDMAKVQLKYGKDPEIRKMAEDIIKAQETEIASMKAWLAKHKK